MNEAFMRGIIENAVKNQSNAIVKESYEHAMLSIKNDKSYLQDKEQFELTYMFLGIVESELVNRKLMTWADIEEAEEELTM